VEETRDWGLRDHLGVKKDNCEVKTENERGVSKELWKEEKQRERGSGNFPLIRGNLPTNMSRSDEKEDLAHKERRNLEKERLERLSKENFKEKIRK